MRISLGSRRAQRHSPTTNKGQKLEESHPTTNKGQKREETLPYNEQRSKA